MIDKKTLQNYQAMEIELDNLCELIERIEARIVEAKTSKLSQEPKGQGVAADMIGANIVRLESLRDRYIKRCEDLNNTIREIENAINDLSPRERTLIRCKYIEGMEWEDIAKRIKLRSARQAQRIHGNILENLKKNP